MVPRISRTHRRTAAAVALFLASVLVSGCETSSAISQGPNPVKCRVTLATPPALDAVGGAGSLAITTQPECVWDAATTTDWISGLSPVTGQGSATVSFRVAVNDAASPRDGAILVNGEQARVSQRARCRYDVSPSNFGTGASGGSSTLSIATSNECAWTAARDVTWITFTSSTSGSGNGTVGFSVAPSRDDVRTASITVGGQRIVVTQASGVPPPTPPAPPPPQPPAPPPPPVCTYTLSRSADFVGAGEGGGSINIYTTSACRWTAVSNASWIILASPPSGTGNGYVDYHYTTNPARQQRAGTISIAGLTFTVTQPAAP
jgi:hypothetical protein